MNAQHIRNWLADQNPRQRRRTARVIGSAIARPEDPYDQQPYLFIRRNPPILIDRENHPVRWADPRHYDHLIPYLDLSGNMRYLTQDPPPGEPGSNARPPEPEPDPDAPASYRVDQLAQPDLHFDQDIPNHLQALRWIQEQLQQFGIEAQLTTEHLDQLEQPLPPEPSKYDPQPPEPPDRAEQLDAIVGQAALDALTLRSDPQRLRAIRGLGRLLGPQHVAELLLDLAFQTQSEPTRTTALQTAARGLGALQPPNPPEPPAQTYTALHFWEALNETPDDYNAPGSVYDRLAKRQEERDRDPEYAGRAYPKSMPLPPELAQRYPDGLPVNPEYAVPDHDEPPYDPPSAPYHPFDNPPDIPPGDDPPYHPFDNPPDDQPPPYNPPGYTHLPHHQPADPALNTQANPSQPIDLASQPVHYPPGYIPLRLSQPTDTTPNAKPAQKRPTPPPYPTVTGSPSEPPLPPHVLRRIRFIQQKRNRDPNRNPDLNPAPTYPASIPIHIHSTSPPYHP